MKLDYSKCPQKLNSIEYEYINEEFLPFKSIFTRNSMRSITSTKPSIRITVQFGSRKKVLHEVYFFFDRKITVFDAYVPVSTNSRIKPCETLWSAREIASVALSAEQERHTENVFHIVLSTQLLT